MCACIWENDEQLLRTGYSEHKQWDGASVTLSLQPVMLNPARCSCKTPNVYLLKKWINDAAHQRDCYRRRKWQAKYLTLRHFSHFLAPVRVESSGIRSKRDRDPKGRDSPSLCTKYHNYI